MSTLTQIERSIDQLSLSEQLWLVERLVQRIRKKTANQRRYLESDLIAMASDPEIQRELRQIEEEFAYTEADGLDLR